MSKAGVLGDASELLPLGELTYESVASVPEFSHQARKGECAAAFPVF